MRHDPSCPKSRYVGVDLRKTRVIPQETPRVGDPSGASAGNLDFAVIWLDELPENAWILYSSEEVVAFVNNEEIARWDRKSRKWQWNGGIDEV